MTLYNWNHEKNEWLRQERGAWLVPFAENSGGIFLKTIIPSRKITKLYLGGNPK